MYEKQTYIYLFLCCALDNRSKTAIDDNGAKVSNIEDVSNASTSKPRLPNDH